jgi:hypothetical protein
MALKPLVPQGRNGTVFVVDATFDSILTRIVTGSLELAFYGDNSSAPLLHMSVPDVTVTPGMQATTLTLPATPPLYGSQVTLDARIVTPRQTFDLGQHLLFAPSLMQRAFAIGVCDSWTGTQRRLGDLLATMALERFDPQKSSAESGVFRESPASTMPVPITPDRLPTSPLGYTPFDIVILGDEGFGEASPRALEALGQWVRAGGSVLILPSTRVQAHHLSLLTTLASDTPSPPTFLAAPDGKLMIDNAPPATPLLCLYAGLGRAVVATPAFNAQRDGPSRPWLEAVLFLWKVRQSQWAPMLQGSWLAPPPQAPQPGMPASSPPVAQDELREEGRMARGAAGLPAPFSLAVQSDAELARLRQWLAPRSVRLVPLPLIALLLAGYVLLIGPVDYLLLGRLRKRSWTWLMLPLVTVLVTLATVWLSQHYMGSSSVTRTLHVIDVGRDNQMLRQTRIILRFSGGNQDQQTQHRQALATALPAMNDDWRQARMPLHAQPFHYVGRPPQQYTVTQRLDQWTTSLSRVTQIEPGPLRHALDFSNFLQVNLDDDTARNEALQQLTANVKAPAAARVLFSRSKRDSGLVNTDPGLHIAHGLNLFSIVSQVAPTGGPSLEDLFILDTTDPDQWLVVVAGHDGDDIYHYRHLVRRSR